MKNTVCYIINKFKTKLRYLLLYIIAFSMIVVLFNNRGMKNFQNLKEAFKYYNKCEVSLIVDGEKSVLVLGMKDNVIVRDFFYKSNEGYFSPVGFDYKTVFMNAIDGFAYEIFYVKKTDEYYIRVYSSVGELPQISDSCDSVFYSLQPFPSNITKSKIYYAFVKDFNDDYYLKINDELTFRVNQGTNSETNQGTVD